MVPSYVRFSELESCGDSQGVIHVLDRVWRYIDGTKAPLDELARLAATCEAAAPDTEQDASKLRSAALDTAVALGEAVKAIGDGSSDHAVQIATLALDSVDMFIQLTEDIPPAGREMEEYVRSHRLMRRELNRQIEDLAELIRIDAVSPGDVDHFRRRSSYDLLGREAN
jgi:uncharacterized protein YjaG (DUF416 family)